MSAYLADPQTFGLLAHFAIETKAVQYGVCHNSRLDTTDAVVDELVRANLVGLGHRYPDCDPTEFFQACDHSLFILDCRREARRMWNVPPIEILKSCACLEYQSCDSDEWYEALAFRILTCIKDSAIAKLEGWEDAQWGYTTKTPPDFVVNMSDLDGRDPEPGETVRLFS